MVDAMIIARPSGQDDKSRQSFLLELLRAWTADKVEKLGVITPHHHPHPASKMAPRRSRPAINLNPTP